MYIYMKEFGSTCTHIYEGIINNEKTEAFYMEPKYIKFFADIAQMIA